MPSPRLALKLVMAGVLLASAGYSLRQLRELAALKRELSAPGASPEEALAKLAQTDGSGVVRALVEAQLGQVQRLGGLPEGGAVQSSAPAPEPSEPAAAADSAGQRLFSAGAAGGSRRTGAGTGVLIDHKTGERLVVRAGSGRSAAGEASPARPLRPDFRGLTSGDNRSRRNKALALLLATVVAAVLLVLRARRATIGA